MSSVDVVVPCYQYGVYLEACVTSVLTQRGVAVRVFIVDDCSPDCTAEVGRRLAARDPRVVFTRHEKNAGHIATYNEALARLDADYCLLLSPDDLLAEGALARATAVMDEHPEVGLTYGRDIPFVGTPPSDEVPASSKAPRFFGYPEFLALACRLGRTPIQAPTVVVRTSLHHAIGYYLPELPHSGDTEIWLRMAQSAGVCELDQVQAFRRQHATNMSLQFSPLARLEEQWKAFETHFRRFVGARPEIAPLEAVVGRAIAEQAFWSGVRAFEAGDSPACDRCLAFAVGICPEIGALRSWKRFEGKRMAPAWVWRRMTQWRGPARGRGATG